MRKIIHKIILKIGLDFIWFMTSRKRTALVALDLLSVSGLRTRKEKWLWCVDNDVDPWGRS